MLNIPIGGPSYYNIVSMDPGTHKLGVGIISVDIVSREIVSSTAMTLTALKIMDRESFLIERFGERNARIQALGLKLGQIFEFYQPYRIVAESPFYNPRMPAAFAALVETLDEIGRRVREFSEWRSLHLIDPSSVKNAVGAKGDGSKDAVKKKVLSMSQLRYQGDCDISQLDEHAIDALAVGYAHYCQFKG